MTAPSGPDRPQAIARGFGAAADIARSAAAVAALLGFLLVVLARTGLDWFYGHFGVTPEEVGLDQTALLLQTTATGLIVLGTALAAGLTAVVARTRWTGAPSAGSPPRRQWVLPGTARWQLAMMAAPVLTAYYLWGVLTAQQNLEAIRAGRSSTSQVLAHGEVTAACVEVWWTVPAIGPAMQAAGGSRFVLLGSAGGVAVLYDPRTAQTVRVPASALVTRSC